MFEKIGAFFTAILVVFGGGGIAKYQGNYTGATTVDSRYTQQCVPVGFTITISKDGKLQGTANDGGYLTGSVTKEGALMGTSGAVDFNGVINGKVASGRWSTNSLSPIDCSGSFTFDRTSRSTKVQVNTNTGSVNVNGAAGSVNVDGNGVNVNTDAGSVNVSNNGVNVNTGSSGVNVNAGGVNVNTGSTQTNSIVSGSWSGSTRVTSGSCVAVTLRLNISNGRVSGTASDGGSFVGTLASNGRLTGTSGAVNFVGTVSGNSGSGTWSTNDFSPVDCSGTFTLSKGSTSSAGSVNVNTGSGSVNVNVGNNKTDARNDINSGANDINDAARLIDISI